MTKSCPNCGMCYIAKNCEYCPYCGHRFAPENDLPDFINELFNADKTINIDNEK